MRVKGRKNDPMRQLDLVLVVKQETQKVMMKGMPQLEDLTKNLTHYPTNKFGSMWSNRRLKSTVKHEEKFGPK